MEINYNTVKRMEYLYSNILFFFIAIVQGIITYGWYHQWKYLDNLTFGQSFFLIYSYTIFMICKLLTCLIIAPKFYKELNDDDKDY